MWEVNYMSEKRSSNGMTRRGFMRGTGIAALTGAGALMGIGIKRVEALPAPQKWDDTTEVVVAGGGMAGLCAAVTAAEAGAKVMLLEAFAVTGGNSSLSTAWFNAANSPVQKKMGIRDSADSFYDDSMKLSDNRRDPKITRIMADESGGAIQWLIDHGVVFLDVVEPAMGSPEKRVIQADGYGAKVVKILADLCREKGVSIKTKARVLNVYSQVSKGMERIAGVEAEIDGKTQHIGARSVILATGGFMNNKELVMKFLPQWEKTLVSGTPTNVGDGLVIGLVEGADTVNIDRALVTPTLEVKTKAYLTSGALTGGAILVNEKGARFTDELTGYTEVSLEMLKQKKVYEVMVEKCHPKVTDFIKKNIVKRADSIADLAGMIEVDAAVLEKTIGDFNKATAGQLKDAFGRQTFREMLEPPLYFMQVNPVLLLTLGGLKISEGAEVLNIRDDMVLQGLHAAGELVGGYIDYGYRTGDSMMYCTVFGIIAGKNAAAVTELPCE